MSVKGAQARITQAVTSWEGVTVAPHRFGGVEYVIGKREVGRIHGDHMVDIPFPKKVRDVLAAGRVSLVIHPQTVVELGRGRCRLQGWQARQPQGKT